MPDGIIILGPHRSAGHELLEPAGKAVPPRVRPVFAIECPSKDGDNCLLTLGSAFIDLPFSRLLALRGSVAARLVTAANRGERLGQTPGGELSLHEHGV
jgi:hypothetical protein